MKSKLFALAVVLFVFSSNASFAFVPKIPVKSGIGIALDAYKISREESRKGVIFQRNKDYNNAALCYIKSVQLWSDEKVYFNLSFCFLALKEYVLAERTALAGLELVLLEGRLESREYFMGLLGDIYYNSGNLGKSLLVYERALSLTNSNDISLLLVKRIEEIREILGVD